MLSVHDTVAQKNYDPVLPPMPDDIDDEEDSVKIIRLVKNREPLVSFGLPLVLGYDIMIKPNLMGGIPYISLCKIYFFCVFKH